VLSPQPPSIYSPVNHFHIPMPLSRYPHLQSNPFPPLTSSVHPLPPDLTVHASAYRESAGQICIHRPSAGRRAPSLKTSQGQYATLYLAAPSAALSLSLACAPSPRLLARAPELKTLAIQPRETLTLATVPPREATGAPGPAPYRRPRSDAAAPIEVGLARIGPEFVGSLPGRTFAPC
jgi:hypothetical protein